jgi:hypothetical protein
MSKRIKLAALLQTAGTGTGVASLWIRFGLWAGLGFACIALLSFGVAAERDDTDAG